MQSDAIGILKPDLVSAISNSIFLCVVYYFYFKMYKLFTQNTMPTTLLDTGRAFIGMQYLQNACLHVNLTGGSDR